MINNTDNSIPQFIYELSDDEKMFLLKYRVLSKENKEVFISMLTKQKENRK